MDIPLTQGRVAYIDDADWPLVAPYRWYAANMGRGCWYAHATQPGGNSGSTKLQMHNLILGLKHVDHIDEDGLNNRRGNLRPCTHSQNQQNTGPRGGSSQFKGVSWDAWKEKWRVAFRCKGRHFFVGNFSDELEAARQYNAAILREGGEFARLNVLPD